MAISTQNLTRQHSHRQQNIERVTLIVTGALLVLASLIVIETTATLFLAFELIAIVLLTEHAAFIVVRESSGDSSGGSLNLKILLRYALISIPCGILLEFLTVLGTPEASVFIVADWSKTRTVLFMLIAFACMVDIPVMLRQLKEFHGEPRQHEGVLRTCKNHLALLISCLIAALIAGFSCSRIFAIMTIPCLVFCFAAFISLFAGILFARKRIPIENLFLVVVLSMGGFLAICLPAETTITWDDETHYRRAVAVSYLIYPQYSQADYTLLTQDTIPDENGMPQRPDISNWNEESISKYHSILDEQSKVLQYRCPTMLTGVSGPPHYNEANSPSTLSYVPMGIGLWAGRALHLPFAATFALGRITNLVFYGLIVFESIRIASDKKLLLFVLGLIPTVVFMASNYSYDPWVYGWMMLGVALLIRELHDSTRAISPAALGWLAAAFILSISVKSVYFPLAALLFFLPGSKFSGKRQASWYRIGVCALGLFLVASFVVPYLTTQGAGYTDTRGGDTDAGRQVSFIVSNIPHYLNILGNYMFGTLLSPSNSGSFFYLLAYPSLASRNIAASSTMASLPACIILAVSLLDSSKSSRAFTTLRRGIFTLLFCLCAIALVVTSMYVAFTPVGSDQVSGVQFRYLLPTFAPFCVFSLGFGPDGKGAGTSVIVSFSALIALLVVASFGYSVLPKFNL
jgi:uncharacterized membrane protein